MMSYSQEDKEAFARKDRMIVAQSTLQRAIEYAALYKIKQDEVLEVAETFFNYVFSKADGYGNTGNNNDNASTSNTVPTPTLKQKEWLDRIQEKHGFSAEEVFHQYGKFPNNKNEALEVVKIMKG